jgi:hypothetical protein
MPCFDVRQDDGTLDPLASFKVLAVMCSPHDRVLREKMLGNVQKETKVLVIRLAQMRLLRRWLHYCGSRPLPLRDSSCQRNLREQRDHKPEAGKRSKHASSPV